MSGFKKKCGRCGEINQPDASHCGRCGAKFAKKPSNTQDAELQNGLVNEGFENSYSESVNDSSGGNLQDASTKSLAKQLLKRTAKALSFQKLIAGISVVVFGVIFVLSFFSVSVSYSDNLKDDRVPLRFSLNAIDEVSYMVNYKTKTDEELEPLLKEIEELFRERQRLIQTGENGSKEYRKIEEKEWKLTAKYNYYNKSGNSVQHLMSSTEESLRVGEAYEFPMQTAEVFSQGMDSLIRILICGAAFVISVIAFVFALKGKESKMKFAAILSMALVVMSCAFRLVITKKPYEYIVDHGDMVVLQSYKVGGALIAMLVLAAVALTAKIFVAIIERIKESKRGDSLTKQQKSSFAIKGLAVAMLLVAFIGFSEGSYATYRIELDIVAQTSNGKYTITGKKEYDFRFATDGLIQGFWLREYEEDYENNEFSFEERLKEMQWQLTNIRENGANFEYFKSLAYPPMMFLLYSEEHKFVFYTAQAAWAVGLLFAFCASAAVALLVAEMVSGKKSRATKLFLMFAAIFAVAYLALVLATVVPVMKLAKGTEITKMAIGTAPILAAVFTLLGFVIYLVFDRKSKKKNNESQNATADLADSGLPRTAQES